MSQKPHVVMIPSPGMGHLIPLTELAKKLVLQYDLVVTFIITTTGPPPKPLEAVLSALPQGINCIFLPPVSFEDVGDDVRNETQIFLTLTRSLSSIRDLFKSLIACTKLVALVVDPFGTDLFGVALEFNVPPYIFFSSNATALSLLFLLPKLDEMVSCEYKDLPEPIKPPGSSVLLHGRDLPDPVQNRKADAYNWFLHHTKQHSLAEGIIVNTLTELEEGAMKALQKKEPGRPPVYPIGPIIQSGSSNEIYGSECLKWLDGQPKRSVLFVSFGSGGTLSHQQLEELALGLEISEQKFLWVVRCPDDKSANATYFSVETDKNPFGFLPKGYLDRTKGRGLLVPHWAPQIQILGHGSTGGFLTHCGWNSVLESIVHGVPLIAWPLYAEQRMNAVLLTEELKAALRPMGDEDGLGGKEEIAKVVKDLIQGEEGVRIRDRMNRLKDAAAKAVSEEGSSTKSLHELVLKWKSQSDK